MTVAGLAVASIPLVHQPTVPPPQVAAPSGDTAVLGDSAAAVTVRIADGAVLRLTIHRGPETLRRTGRGDHRTFWTTRTHDITARIDGSRSHQVRARRLSDGWSFTIGNRTVDLRGPGRVRVIGAPVETAAPAPAPTPTTAPPPAPTTTAPAPAPTAPPPPTTAPPPPTTAPPPPPQQAAPAAGEPETHEGELSAASTDGDHHGDAADDHQASGTGRWVRLEDEPAPRFGPPSGRITYTRKPASGAKIGFITTCGTANIAPDDPIVFPGEPGRSHLHDFFGNTSVDAHSTTESLAAGGSACWSSDDRSAYWVPAVMVDGQRVRSAGTSFYYQAMTDPAKIVPFPTGLRMIAGNANATSYEGPEIGWFEEHRNAQNNTFRAGGRMITAERTGQIVVRINFPDCWDGRHLDSPDHKSHMAYSSGRDANGYRVCPESHPVPVPRLAMFVRYATDGGPDTSLSAGPWYTLHADFWNVWHPEVLSQLVRDCINTSQNCDRPADEGASRPRFR